MNDIIYICEYYDLKSEGTVHSEVVYQGSVIYDDRRFHQREYMHNGFLNTLIYVFLLKRKLLWKPLNT
jgi:hypothetical protein